MDIQEDADRDVGIESTQQMDDKSEVVEKEDAVDTADVAVEEVIPSQTTMETDEKVGILTEGWVYVSLQGEAERLRAAFYDLKAEVEAIKDTTQEGLSARHRGIGLRILKDRIDSVIEEGETGRLRSCLTKIQGALNEERRRCFQLEQQLRLRDKQDDTFEATKERMLYWEGQAKEWSLKHEQHVKDSATLKTQLEKQNTELQSLRASLTESNSVMKSIDEISWVLCQTIEGLQSKHQQTEEAHASTISDVQSELERERQDKASALVKIAHLERVIAKLTEESPHADDTKRATSSVSHPTKQIVAFPDPPSEEASPKIPDISTGGAQDIVSPEKPLMDGSSIEQATTSDGPLSESAGQQKWSWNVSGLWGYVTGESSQ